MPQKMATRNIIDISLHNLSQSNKLFFHLYHFKLMHIWHNKMKDLAYTLKKFFLQETTLSNQYFVHFFIPYATKFSSCHPMALRSTNDCLKKQSFFSILVCMERQNGKLRAHSHFPSPLSCL